MLSMSGDGLKDEVLYIHNPRLPRRRVHPSRGLIRCSNSHPDLAPATTDAQIEPGAQMRLTKASKHVQPSDMARPETARSC